MGKKAGVTTKIQTRVKIFDNPPIYLIDTPGIYNPHINTPLEGLKISLTGGTNDSLTTLVNVADYLLFKLNNSSHISTYYKKLGLAQPTDTITDLLLHLCKFHNLKFNDRARIMKNMPDVGEDLKYDLDKGASLFIDMYRDGLFGKMTLDDCSKDSLKEYFTNLKQQI